MAKKNQPGKPAQRVGVLKDHTRHGKRFVPPIREAIGDGLAKVLWLDDMVPELMWLALLRERLGLAQAVHVAEALGSVLRGALSLEPPPPFAFVSDFGTVPEDLRPKARESIPAEVLEPALDAIAPLMKLYPHCPMRWLASDPWLERTRVDSDIALPLLKRVVGELSERRGKPATEVQVSCWYLMLVSGRVLYGEGVELPDFHAVSGYPETEESRLLAAHVRASVNSITSLVEWDHSWAQHFWQQGVKLSLCELPPIAEQLGQDDREYMRHVMLCGRQFRTELAAQFESDWNAAISNRWPSSASEVLDGLISRQIRLCSALTCEPPLWAMDVGHMVMRAMVETHITLAWFVNCATTDRFNQFIDHGLGQDKLLHAVLEEALGEDADATESLNDLKAWIESQVRFDLLPVDVGHWAQGNLRDLAEQADCLDLHRLDYQALSRTVHGSWGAIARLNLIHCMNPLHRYHRVPSQAAAVDLQMPNGAVRMLKRSYSTWRLGVGLPAKELSLFDGYFARLNEQHAGETQDE